MAEALDGRLPDLLNDDVPWDTAGQLRGVVAGLGGAAALERLGAQVGRAGRMLAALRTGIWTVAALLLAVNVVGLFGWLRRRRA